MCKQVSTTLIEGYLLVDAEGGLRAGAYQAHCRAGEAEEQQDLRPGKPTSTPSCELTARVKASYPRPVSVTSGVRQPRA